MDLKSPKASAVRVCCFPAFPEKCYRSFDYRQAILPPRDPENHGIALGQARAGNSGFAEDFVGLA
jgi:hypothetical protein